MRQYVIIRRDLLSMKPVFTIGALIAQGCHATTQVIASNWSLPSVQSFIAQGSKMTVCVLACDDEPHLRRISDDLKSGNIAHSVWTENPEMIDVAIATVPIEKADAPGCLISLKTFK